MNLTFRLLRDKSSLKDPFHPFQVVSLWDILRFYARNFVRICSNLAHCAGIINALMHPDYSVDLAEILLEIQELGFRAATSGLTNSASNADVLVEHINYLCNQNVEKQHYDEIRGRLDSLIQGVLHEIDNRTMLMLYPTGSGFYEMEGTFLGEEVLSKFPELRKDAEEAGNCFAVGRYTASVFHMMRILEVVLRKFARKLKVTPRIFDKKAWGIILGEINKKLEHEQIDPPKVRAKKDRRKITHGFLNGVRMAWRDDTIHVRVDYDDKDAIKVLNAVKLFVEDYAKLR